MFKFFIDNIEINETPKGWEDIATTLRIDKELKGLFTVMDATLSFYADGYDVIKTSFDDSHLNTLTFEIRQRADSGEEVYYPIFYGILFMRDVELTEGNEGNEAKCKITDNSFFAKIANNKGIKCKAYSSRSKNEEEIQAATRMRITYFTPSTGVQMALTGGAGNCNEAAYTVYELLEHMIAFMTDGTVDFYSDTFDVTNGEYGQFLITSGYFIRKKQDTLLGTDISEQEFYDTWPEMSFSDLYAELDKQFNIGFVMGFSGSRPYIRIEKYDYLYPNVTIHNIENVDTIKRKVASEFLYSSVKLGSETTDKSSALSFPEDIRMVGFKEESYFITGTSNIERELNLSNRFIISSNIIEDMVINSNDSYDDTFVMVQCTYVSGTRWDADNTNWVNLDATRFYNEQLTSGEKINRYLGAMPNSIGQQLTPIDSRFTAANPTSYDAIGGAWQVLQPYAASQESYDPSSVYNNATYEYTALNGGVYTFRFIGDFKTSNPTTPTGNTSAQIRVYLENVTTVFDKQIASFYDTTILNNSIIHIDGSGSMNLSTGDVVRLKIEFRSLGVAVNVKLQSGGLFLCTSGADGGGSYRGFDPALINIIRDNFEAPMTLDEFKSIQDDPRGFVSYRRYGGNKRFAHIEEIKYFNFRKIAKFTMIANETNNS
jgi:hypothetical protein